MLSNRISLGFHCPSSDPLKWVNKILHSFWELILYFSGTECNLFCFITTFWSYNSHIIQFTHLKCRIQWFLVYSQSCTVIITILEYFHRPKRNPVPISSLTPIPQFFSLPCSRQLHIYLLSLWISLVLGLLYKWNPTICDLLCLLLSVVRGRLSSAAACVSTSIFF